ncbi:hypothetical protein SAMN04487950_3804 [Halogranum rubrum]|uniref:Uncharacterized protein n=1 Tax=Halogranum rubrum TaxID=553466 RepID=A0A1I4HT98_9EURY|nr:hypothetical protein SAMN04487950_3804 [Halogranum rubrum]
MYNVQMVENPSTRTRLILRFGFVEAMYERNRLRSGSWEQVALPTSDPDAP